MNAMSKKQIQQSKAQIKTLRFLNNFKRSSHHRALEKQNDLKNMYFSNHPENTLNCIIF